jgi:hypothetical protein
LVLERLAIGCSIDFDLVLLALVLYDYCKQLVSVAVLIALQVANIPGIDAILTC